MEEMMLDSLEYGSGNGSGVGGCFVGGGLPGVYSSCSSYGSSLGGYPKLCQICNKKQYNIIESSMFVMIQELSWVMSSYLVA